MTSAPVRVLHVLPGITSDWGGPPRVVRDLVQAVIPEGFEGDVYSFTYPIESGLLIPESERVQLRRIRTSYLGWRGLSVRVLLDLVRSSSRYDLIHLHELWHFAGLATLASYLLKHIPYVVSVHGQLDSWALEQNRLKKQLAWHTYQKRILRNAAGLHALSSAEAEILSEIGVNNLVVSPWGISPPPRNVRDLESVKVPRNRIIAVFLGRLHPKKGLEGLFECVRDLNAEGAKLHLIVAGSGDPTYERFLREVTSAWDPTGEHVSFVGQVSDDSKYALLQRADIFVLPSFSEGFSYAILEALVVGTPVVITPACNFPLVESCEAGLVVNPTVNDLTAAIGLLVKDELLRIRMGKAAYHLASKNFSWTEVAKKMANFYREALKGNRPR